MWPLPGTQAVHQGHTVTCAPVTMIDSRRGPIEAPIIFAEMEASSGLREWWVCVSKFLSLPHLVKLSRTESQNQCQHGSEEQVSMTVLHGIKAPC